jgi:hypothetical protein
MLQRHVGKVVTRPGQTLAVSITGQKAAKGKDVLMVAAGHAPFKENDVGRTIGIKHCESWGHARVIEVGSEKQVAVRILTSFASTAPSEAWLFGPEHWTFQDLRRTMRTHLSALPVEDLVRELVIAHTKPALHKVYDLHAYAAEKRRALELWTARLLAIVELPPASVTSIEHARQKRTRKKG